jgi:hypothetical protein
MVFERLRQKNDGTTMQQLISLDLSERKGGAT